MCFPWPSSCLAALLFALNSAAASTRPGACAITRAQPPHGQPTHSVASIDIDYRYRYAASSLTLSSLNPCLYSSRPRPCSCESRTKLFLPHPPSLNAACAARSAPSSRVSPPLRIPVLTAYVSMGSRRTSPIAIDFVGAPQFSQPYALPDSPLLCCLSVCRSRTALIS